MTQLALYSATARRCRYADYAVHERSLAYHREILWPIIPRRMFQLAGILTREACL